MPRFRKNAPVKSVPVGLGIHVISDGKIGETSYTNNGYIPEDGDSGVSTSSSSKSIDDKSDHKDNSVSNSNTSTTDQKGHKSDGIALKKSINLLHCTAIMIAVTGHSSIFISPTAILKTTGSLGMSLVVWLVGGLMNLFLALCFAELGTMLPQAGGPYAYVMRTFGPLPGFLIMWGYVVLIAGPFWAFLAYTAGLYIIQPFFDGCDVPEIAVKILSGWIMITLVVLNCVYMKYITKVQTLLSSAKVVALIIIVTAGIVMLVQGKTENMQDMFEGTTTEPGEIAVAIFYSIFSYGGWQVMTSLMEEVKNPGRDLPVASYLTFIFVIIKYLMTNVAYFTLLTQSEVVSSSAVAILWVQRFYRPITALISILVALTSIGALNASIMGHSRLLFAGARVGHMPTLLGMMHTKYLTPWPAIFVLLAWSLAMMYTGGVYTMMEYISFFSTTMGIAVILSLLYLRWTKPDEHRPYRVSTIIPVSQLFVNVAVWVLAVYQKPHQMGVALGILLAGIPVYWFGVLWNPKPRVFREFIEKWTIVAQKVFGIAKST